jgi:hypothetical protein
MSLNRRKADLDPVAGKADLRRLQRWPYSARIAPGARSRGNRIRMLFAGTRVRFGGTAQRRALLDKRRIEAVERVWAATNRLAPFATASAAMTRKSPIRDFLDSNGRGGSPPALGSIGFHVRTGSKVSNHKPARVDTGRRDLARRLDRAVRTLTWRCRSKPPRKSGHIHAKFVT